MIQKTVPWGEATLTQLKMFAAQVLGMMTHPNIGEQALRAKIRAAFSGEEITIMVDDTVDQPPQAEEPAPQPEPQPEPFPEMFPEGLTKAVTLSNEDVKRLAPGLDDVLAPKPGKPLVGGTTANDPKVLITITEVEGPGGKRPVFVSVNGVAMLVPRGRLVEIPYRYYMDLVCAVKTVHHQDEETGEIISSEVPSYPFSVNKMPPQSEIDAYLAAEQHAA